MKNPLRVPQLRRRWSAVKTLTSPLYGGALCLLGAITAHAAEFIIPDGDTAQLSSAIAIANGNDQDDTLRIARSATMRAAARSITPPRGDQQP
ncbi:MAG: hypothetical protein L0Z50_42460 [Verrucomicrobiales bacterium]|nr:hypothetical protein [Verrucomicrobiales bacterium]